MIRFFVFLFVFLFKLPALGQNEIPISPTPRAGKVTLNNIVKSIEYVPLETNNKCLIGKIDKFTISENFILVLCSQTYTFFLFTRNGKFISQIGSIGGGPGEYNFGGVQPVFIDEKNKQIGIYYRYGQNLLIYGLDGVLIRSFNQLLLGDVSYYNGFFLGKYNNMGNTSFSYRIYSNNFKSVFEKIIPVSYKFRGNFSTFRYNFCEYVYNGQIHVKETFLNDTVYIINPDFSFTSKYIINLPTRYKVTKDIRSNSELFSSKFSEFILPYSMYETKEVLLFEYVYGNKINYSYYQKDDRSHWMFSSSSGIPNDYDGGLDFWPKVQYNELLISFYDADLFVENRNNPKTLKPQGPADAISRVNQLSRRIDPEDNPVMVIVTLK